MSDRFFLKLIAVFVILTGIIVAFQSRLASINAHFNVLLIGNLGMALITLFSYRMSRKGLQSANNNAFVRAVYGSTLSKLMLCLLGIAAYVLTYRPNISKATIFILLGFYLIYSVFETINLFNKLKQQSK
ncbi:hypothetical protein [Chitinophaga sp. Cy-1792]|uniref:hypothetical protein n=1 Tax=Chitinophaga sp. Cy-1792 TaxID=2608339 RepID=UPI00141DEB63|nr:hypothetical protein [Chitinophaga sp. Cy-1792]NIG53457.1 hypothetical protein [Chitinophaga sp. Cy-1792]